MSNKFDRKMLARFLPDPESIRAFESLLRATSSELPEQVKAALTAANDALLKYSALEALGGAAKIGFQPIGDISASNVQFAIAELEAEKPSREDVQAGFNVATSSGSGDALVASFSPEIESRKGGALLIVRSATANATINPTVKVDGLPPIEIVKAGGVALVPGEIAANNWLLLSYDTTLSKYILHNPTLQINRAIEATSINGGALAGRRNRVHNGNFTINQRGVSGTVTLTAGQYGHDRWKAGASGCSYSFTKIGADTIVTVLSGTLMQVVDGDDIEEGLFTLSNKGTASVRHSIGGTAPSGAFAPPPIAVNTSSGQQVRIEFSTGTVSLVQLERGPFDTPFERRSRAEEMYVCQFYYWRELPCMALNTPVYASNCVVSWPIKFARSMRTVPVLSKNTAGSTYAFLANEVFDQPSKDGARLLYVSTAEAPNANILYSATSWLEASADLQ